MALHPASPSPCWHLPTELLFRVAPEKQPGCHRHGNVSNTKSSAVSQLFRRKQELRTWVSAGNVQEGTLFGFGSGPSPRQCPLYHAHLYCTPVHQSHGGTETGRLVPRTMSAVRPGYLFVPQRGREGQPARQKRVLEHKCKNHTTMSRGRFRKRLPITTHEPPSMAMTTSHHLAPGPQDTWLIAGIQALNAGQKAEHHRIPGPRPRGTFSGCCQLPRVPAPRRQDSHAGGINRGRGRAGRR